MTHPLLKTPVRKWVTSVFAWLVTLIQQHVTPKVTMQRRRLRAAWRALRGLEAHHGAALLLPGEDSLRFQWRLAVALGDTERALIVQKFDEWIKRNQKEGRPDTTFNGYADWVRDHFGHLSEDQFGRHVRTLETMGVLVTQRRGGRDQRKEYRINHRRLNTLLAAVKAADSSVKTRYSNVQMASAALNNDSNSSNQSSNPNPLTQEKPTKPGRGGRRAGAGRKSKSKEALTEQPQPSDSDSHASDAAVQPGQSKETGDSNFAAPIPSSASPLSPGEAELQGRMREVGLEGDKAAALIEQYGENRVRAVVHKCEQRLRPDSREQRIERPAGWIIRELENDVFKLGEMDYRPSSSEMDMAFFEDDTPLSEAVPLPEALPIDHPAYERWIAAVELMEEPMRVKGPAVFSNTVRDALLVGYDDETATYRVAAEMVPFCHHYMNIILPALEQVHGGPVKIEFEAL